MTPLGREEPLIYRIWTAALEKSLTKIGDEPQILKTHTP
jgi:hypothetical protein